jgi:hypothetical protein
MRIGLINPFSVIRRQCLIGRETSEVFSVGGHGKMIDLID